MKRLLLLIWIFFLSGNVFIGAQTLINDQSYETQLKDRGEVYFRFSIAYLQSNPGILRNLGTFLSIDKIGSNYVYAYANARGFTNFLTRKINYQLLQPPSLLLSREKLQRQSFKSTSAWNYYPTYQEYVSLMYQFQKSYPQLCKVVNIGKSVQGRDLLFVNIRNQKDSLLNKPSFMYTSTMHGDETTGYILMLHLIDYLLKNYDKVPEVTNLVDSLDIWINPLANPDGTYAGGNSSVYGATRFNANHVDLNRNFPDPAAGNHPDGNSWQPETQAFMTFAGAHHFVLSCNLHSGSEVANYPWDTWSVPTADVAWWQYVCRQYADTVHAYSPAGYFTDLNDGITDGYDWYRITGGRQDYMNYFHHDREFTLELSHTKMPDPALLPSYWDYNYRSLLNYMHQAIYGIRGRVSDSLTGAAVKAEVFIDNHDKNHSEVYSDSLTGYYFRPLKGGSYNITFSALGFKTKILKGIKVQDGRLRIINVMLKSTVSGLRESQAFRNKLEAFPNPAHNRLHFIHLAETVLVRMYALSGKLVLSTQVQPGSVLNVGKFPRGFYLLKTQVKGKIFSQKILLQ